MAHILVTYASRLGSTAEIAEIIGMILSEENGIVDILPVEAVRNIGIYDAVVVGSAIRGGKWLPNAMNFFDTHYAVLGKIPVAYFSVSMTSKDDSPESQNAAAHHQDLLFQYFPSIQPILVGMFAGAFDAESVSPMVQLLARGIGITPGDWRDWQAINRWARTLSQMLKEALEPARQVS